MSKKIVKIITPPVASDRVSCDLVTLTEVIWNTNYPNKVYHYGLGGQFGYGVEFKNDIFEMFPYYWGDCTCGIEEAMCDKEAEWCNTHPHSIDCFDTRRKAFEKEWEVRYKDTTSEVFYKALDLFCKQQGLKGYEGSAVYCNCGRDKEYTKWSNDFLNNFHKTNVEHPDYHALTCLINKPNFIHFKSGLIINWYKWIGRSMEVSEDLSIKEWNKIFDECLDSLI